MSKTRREFVTTAAGAGAAFMIVPRHVLGRGFQAPSDMVNVATVGFSGMGASNTRAVLSQNLVAICDVDLDLLDNRLEQFARAAKQPPPQPRPQGQARGDRGFRDGVQGLRSVEGAARGQRTLARSGCAREPRAVRRSADAAGPEIPGLPRDARETKRSRRHHRRHTGSHARRHCLERHGRGQARLRAEADVLVGPRGTAPGAKGQREEGVRADGQSAPFGGRESPRGRVHPGLAPSATSTKSTSGRTGRSASGRRASRGPHRSRPTPNSFAGTIEV